MMKSFSKEELRSLSRKLLRRQAKGFVRRHTRHEVKIVSAILIEDRLVPMPGVINEISRGGVRFRPASTFMIERKGDLSSILVADVYYPGRIMNTSPEGYGIQLMSELDEEIVDDVVGRFGVQQQRAA